MAIQKVSVGDKFKFPAETFNSMVDAIDFVKKINGPQGGTNNTNNFRKIHVLNNSGGDLEKFEILGIDEPIITPTDDQAEFESRITVIGSTPDDGTGGSGSVDHRGRFVVLQEDLPDGDIGRGIISGETLVKISVTDEEHKFAEIDAGVSANLVSANTGSARILWKESGTGTKWALIRIGGGDGCKLPYMFRCTIQEVDCSDENTPPDAGVDEIDYVCIGGKDVWLRIEVIDQYTDERVESWDAPYGASITHIVASDSDQMSSQQITFNPSTTGTTLNTNDLDPDTQHPGDGKWLKGVWCKKISCSGADRNGSGGAITFESDPETECGAYGWIEAKWQMCDSCCTTPLWWGMLREIWGAENQRFCVSSCDQPPTSYGPTYRDVVELGPYNTQEECEEGGFDCDDLPATLSVSYTIEFRSTSGITIEKQVVSGTVSKSGCNYSGTLSRTIYDYYDNGSLCDTRTPDASVSLNYGGEGTNYGWQINAYDAYAYNNNKTDPTASWITVDGAYTSEVFTCATSPQSASVRYTAFSISE